MLTGLTTAIIQQQRFYGGTAEVLETRANVRQAADILPSELRAISPSGGDIYAMTSSSIDYRGSTGSSVVCTINLARDAVTLPPLVTTAQNGTTAWLTAPQAGDSLLIYDHGPTAASADDVWRVYALQSAPSGGTCLTYTANVAEAATGFRLQLTDTLTSTTMPGAAVRFFRRSRYELYNGSDGLGYIGFSDCLATRSPACSSPQPVSGPYLPLGASPAGLTLSFFDANGNATANPTQVARVDVVVRSQTRNNVRTAGYRTGRYTDSLTFSVAARN